MQTRDLPHAPTGGSRAARLMLAAGFCAGVALVLASVSSVSGAGQAAGGAASGGVVRGKVAAQSGGRLPEIVVYLESRDPSYRCPAPASPAIIHQKGAQFSPSLLVIPLGQTVSFINDEETAVEHNVFSKSDSKPFDLGLYKPGVSRSVTFDRVGAVQLACSIHKQMSGAVVVVPTPHFARVAVDGSFEIGGVLPGDYELKTWQRVARYLEAAMPVSISSTKPVEVNIELRRN